MGEFDLIAKYLAPLAGPEGLGLLDDAALYTPPSGFDLVITKDTLVEGVHFPKKHWGANTAEKLLRVNLSDLAAKGARPVGYLLSIAWPQSTEIETYFPAFVKGLQTVQEAFECVLFGGDTVSIDGPMVVTATLIGLVPKGQIVKRSGGQVGDEVWVSGTIGDAGLGLKLILGQNLGMLPNGEAIWTWEEAYFRPVPRLLLRKLLRAEATACADVSDGLLSDLGHIAKASGVGLQVNLADIPLSESSRAWLDANKNNRIETLITSGDDYELVFLANPKSRDDIKKSAKKLGVPLTCIGRAVNLKNGCEGVHSEQASVIVLKPDGSVYPIQKTGYSHF